jgi:hypothetical protein
VVFHAREEATLTPDVYDFVCSIGELIDKLSIQNIICHHANESILAERRKGAPDHERISEAEFRARKAGEQRVRLKNEIDRRIAEAITRGKMGTAPDARTYDLRGIGA